MKRKRPSLSRPQQAHPPGTIIICSGELQRYTAFAQSLVSLGPPPRTKLSWACGVNIAGNLNHAIARAKGEWIWILGDDHIFAPDILFRLLAHEVDVVSPLVLMRHRPFAPIVFKSDLPDGTFEFWQGPDLPSGGLHQVAAASGAGMLVRRHVLEGIDRPYFELGRIKPTEMSEDLYFYRKVREKGFKVYIDLDTMMGHITPAALWPRKKADGRWEIHVDPDCVIPGVML
jgi:glycosyltransferase involved in cell wall biosynthesis